VTFRSSPLLSTFQSFSFVSNHLTPHDACQTPTRTLLSPPAVASRPFPWGSKWAEYMGAFSLCQDTSSGAAFIVGVGTARGRSMGVYPRVSVRSGRLQLKSRVLRLWGAPAKRCGA